MVFLGSWRVNRCYQYHSVVVIWKFNAELEITETLASMNSLSKTIVKNVFKEDEKTWIRYNQRWNLEGMLQLMVEKYV